MNEMQKSMILREGDAVWCAGNVEVFFYLLPELKWIALAKAKDLSVTQFPLLEKMFNHNTGFFGA